MGVKLRKAQPPKNCAPGSEFTRMEVFGGGTAPPVRRSRALGGKLEDGQAVLLSEEGGTVSHFPGDLLVESGNRPVS